MQLLILLIIALVLGYWLARSKYHTSIDKAAQQPKSWWNRLFRRSTTVDMTEKTADEQEET
jgi:hypothetical protein